MRAVSFSLKACLRLSRLLWGGAVGGGRWLGWGVGEREGGLGDDGDAISDGVLAVFAWGGKVRSTRNEEWIWSLAEGKALSVCWKYPEQKISV